MTKICDGDPAKLPVCVPEAGTFSLVPLVRLEQLQGGLKMRGAELFSSSPLLSSPAKEKEEGREMLLSSQAPQEEASVCWEGEGGPLNFPPTFSLFSFQQIAAEPPPKFCHTSCDSDPPGSRTFL